MSRFVFVLFQHSYSSSRAFNEKGLYGKGTYFTQNAGVALGYARKKGDAKDPPVVLVALVIDGKRGESMCFVFFVFFVLFRELTCFKSSIGRR